MTEIIDAVAREKLTVVRFGGDVFLEIRDKDGKLLFSFGMEMIRNDQNTFLHIEQLFKDLKKYIKERRNDFNGTS